MNAHDSRATHEAHEDNRTYVRTLSRHEQQVRDRERRRIASLVGPGHNFGLALDAPVGSDPRYDNTGFAPGGLI